MAKKKKPKLSAEERFRRRHYGSARAVFRNVGFRRVASVSDKEFKFNGVTGDFDDVYVKENVVLLIEHTIHKASKVGDHLKKKHLLFQEICKDEREFLDFLRKRFPKLSDEIGDDYHDDDFIVKIVYNSYSESSSDTRANVPEPIYLDYPSLKYFEKITAITKLSAAKEILQFLQIDPDEVGEGGEFPKKGASDPYRGSILPEKSSGFDKGYKVVSFYADPSSLLERAFVVRRDGWRGSREAYQRMLQKAKIDQIRQKLKKNQTVFVNNLIVTLPDDIQPIGEDKKTIDIGKLTKTEPVQISLPRRPNSIGVIDGQHRLYSYYKTKVDDPTIAKLRNQQNLLVTGVIFPKGTSEAARERFEAALFLTINSNQTNAPKALRQEIQTILKPFENEAIAKRVMHELASAGPLEGYVERYFFDKGLLKTTSIVTYGLAPLVKLSGDDSLYTLIDAKLKDRLEQKEDKALEEYSVFCRGKINEVLGAMKKALGPARWTTDRSVSNRVLNVTYINSFLILMRLLIKDGKGISGSSLDSKISSINTFGFKNYHSSQYNRMAQDIYQKYF